MHNMSMRCCSATLFSLLTLRCSAVKICLLFNRPLPATLLLLISASFAFPSGSVLANPPVLGMTKYSSSSRRTITPCLSNNGFALESSQLPDETILAWLVRKPVEEEVP
jgi:hypothetical protein